MENPISGDMMSGSAPGNEHPGGESDSQETGAAKKRSPWTFKVRSDFIQGTTHKLRKRRRRLTNVSFEARCLYVYLSSFASKKSPVPFPSMNTIQFDTGWGVSTIKKYRRELEAAGLLHRDQQKVGGRWSSNLYTLNVPKFDNGQKHPARSVKKQPPKDQPAESQSSANKPSKRYQGTGRETSAGPAENCEAKTNTTRNTPPPASVAAPASDDLPSAESGAAAPEPPPAVPTPAGKAEHFIKGFKTWASRAKFSATVIPREREALIHFFQTNETITHQELLALMLTAWQCPTKADDQGLQPWWHCNNKAWRIKTFLDFLSNIQDEIGWRGTDKQINRAFTSAEKFFPV